MEGRVIRRRKLLARLVAKPPKGSYDVPRQIFWSGWGSKAERTLEMTPEIFLPDALHSSFGYSNRSLL